MSGTKLKTPNNKCRVCGFFTNMSERKQTAVYLILYTVCYALVMLAIFSKFIMSGKTLIWDLDGMTQHYLVYIYIGEWLREMFANIFTEGKFIIPMWDVNIGAGSDIITTFNYYGLGDPLCLLTAFFNKNNAYYIYDALIVVRLYLAGLFFSFFCFRMKQKGIGAFLGTFTYLFCGYSLLSSVRHPFFILPMVFLPLMLLGAERILDGESPVLFIISVFLSLAINFYFAYMVIMLTVLYVAVRFFTVKREKVFRSFLCTLGRFMLYGILGVMLAAVLLLPVMLVFMNSSRTDLSHEIPVLYDFLYHLRVISGYCGYMNAGSWTVTGFLPITLISALILLRRKGEHTYLKILFCVMTVLLFIPIAGKILNGFSYIANRWVWGYAFILSFITAVMFRHLTELQKKDKIFLSVFTVLYLIVAFVIQKVIFYKANTSVLAQLMILAATVAVIVLCGLIFRKHSKKIIALCISVLCFISVGVNAYYIYYSETVDYAAEFISQEDSVALLNNSVTNKMSDEMQNEFYRYELVPNRVVRNQSIIDNSHGISFYWSLTNDNVSNYLRDMEGITFASHDFLCFDRKTFMDELFSVKYFFTTEGGGPVPYGYEYSHTLSTHIGNYDVYINKYALPLGYGYSDYMTEDAYRKLPSYEKQEALLGNILLEGDREGYNKNTFSTTSKVLEPEFTFGEGITIEDNKFIVTKNNAELTLTFDDVKDCELYVEYNGLHCEDELWTSDLKKMNNEWDSMDIVSKLKVIRRELISRDAKLYKVTTTSDSGSYMFNLSTPDYQGYDGVHDFLANLGYSDESRNSLTIRFHDAGIYSFEKLTVIAQPMENYTEQVTSRSENTLQNVGIIDNGFKGTAELAENQIMFFSVPYSTGFTAYVDGVEQEILKANTWGMALELESGTHEIEFRYRTPGLAAGAVITASGIALLIGVAVIFNNTKLREKFRINKTNK